MGKARKIDNFLDEWLKSNEKIPKLIVGIRQCGKTESIREFAKRNNLQLLELNFWTNPELSEDFNNSLEVDTLISYFSLRFPNFKINPQKTLLFFDEIQECEKALTSLKYFCEDAPEYHVIAAGSLLGLAINRGHFSFPVGKVSMITMYPLDFEEFLMALDCENLIDLIKTSYKNDTPLDNPIHLMILDYYYKYLAIGGMPAAVNAYITKNDFDFVRIAQSDTWVTFFFLWY